MVEVRRDSTINYNDQNEPKMRHIWTYEIEQGGIITKIPAPVMDRMIAYKERIQTQAASDPAKKARNCDGLPCPSGEHSMTHHHRDTIMARRQDWADKALADPLFTPERRCYGTYFQKDLSSGQQTNCYVGIGYLAMLPPDQTPDLTARLDMITGQAFLNTNRNSVSRETRSSTTCPSAGSRKSST